MMEMEMETEELCPSSYFSNFNWLMQESGSTEWTREENKRFESALAMYDKDTPDRWLRVAAMIPGKSVFDVMRQYEELEADVNDIEAGLVPIPGYLTSSFTLEFEGFRKRPSPGERRKGVPWTEAEHRRFLVGLQRHGKGDWRNIARNFVVTKSSTQVASHAQKYFMRQSSGGKDKRRPSIHDITTTHLADPALSDSNEFSVLDDNSTLIPMPRKPPDTPKILLDWSNSNDGVGNPFMQYPHENASHGLVLQGGALRGAHIGPHSSMFQIQSARYEVHG